MSRNHRLDQHFLRSPRVAAELFGHTTIKKRETVYDFGAGSGVITAMLARRVHYVVAVEKDATAVKTLRGNVGDSPNVEIVQGDLMSVPLPTSEFSVFANPPFSFSSLLVKRLLFAEHRPRVIALVAQRQFAQKLVASDRHFTSALGIMLAVRYTARIRKPIQRHDFTPPPAVATVLFEAVRREEPLVADGMFDDFTRFVERAFADAVMFRQYYRGEKKPSELTPDQWVALYEAACKQRDR